MLHETPHLCKTDDERIFLTITCYRQAFAAFFEKFYGCSLVADCKCVRLYKPKWFNEAVTPSGRDMFGFTKRDECIAFLVLLEFFERESRDQEVTVDDHENLRFRFGDWLEYSASRFRALFPKKTDFYSDEKFRQIIRSIMPALEKYRFPRKEKPSADDNVSERDTILECLPAMWHYQATEHATSLFAPVSSCDSEGNDADRDISVPDDADAVEDEP